MLAANADGEVILLRASDGECVVREAVLSNCSSILEGILRDGEKSDNKNGSPRVIAMDDADLPAVRAFLKVATMLSHDSDEVIEMQQVALLVPMIMPLVHKWDARGMMNLSKAAVNASPDPEAALAILTHDLESNGSTAWMQKEVKFKLIRHLCNDSYCVGTTAGLPLNYTPAEEKLALLPQRAAQELLQWTMTEAVYKVVDYKQNEVIRNNIHTYFL